MTVFYFHGFGARLNGRKASSLRGCFGSHAVVEPPDPGFPYCKTLTKPILQKLTDKLRKEPHALLGLFGPNHSSELARLCPELMNFFPRSLQIAQTLFDSLHPDIIVGSSLGGSVAMAMNSRDTPMVLIDPVWNPHIDAGIAADGMPVTGPMSRVLIAAAIAAFKNSVAQMAGFKVPDTIKPQTVILHSAHDQLVGLANSHSLLRNSPIAPDDPSHGRMDRVIGNLTAAGYANHKSDDATRFNDGRLIVIGKDHHNNETDPNDRQNKDPNPHNALIAAVRFLLQEFGPKEVLSEPSASV